VRATLTDGEDGPEIRDETKTGRDRILEAPRSAMAALRTHRKYQNEERLKYAGLWRDLGLIFPSAKGTIMRRQNLQRRSYKPLLKAAGLLDIRLYDLRHTCLTLMRKSGEDLKTAQEVAGHSSIKTTSDTYTHTDSRQMREAADRFEEYLWGRFEGT
jgi:integrase